MLKEKSLSISIFCLAISIIISSVILANAVRTNGEYVGSGLSSMSQGLFSIASNDTNDSAFYRRSTFDLPTASSYLGISESQLISIINSKGLEIPYIRIDGDYVFSKVALDKWLETAKFEIK